ncbi:NifB/NifX family molybdenum-iron cluster-binding protein [candidate division KSB1 bacterium]|nr:NifB/NifX family molybdenum-iron cluster-binding protein [candidate division KSB1 bacterium]
MKVALSADSADLDGVLQQRFGRTKGFLVIDLPNRSVDYIENRSAADQAIGAGIQAAQNVVRAGVAALITGHCGPKAFRVLQAAGIDIYVGCSGTLVEILQKFEAGELACANDADVEGHWV